MNIKEKLVIAERAVKSISRHDDADSIVILAALDRVKEMANNEAAAVTERQLGLAGDSVGASK
jgi:hypothetical protein